MPTLSKKLFLGVKGIQTFPNINQLIIIIPQTRDLGESLLTFHKQTIAFFIYGPSKATTVSSKNLSSTFSTNTTAQEKSHSSIYI